MAEDEIERVRSQKMAALKQAREAYRTWAVESSPLSGKKAGTLSADRLKQLQDAVRGADADLRSYNVEHPRGTRDQAAPPVARDGRSDQEVN
jgi:hypothetical protein